MENGFNLSFILPIQCVSYVFAVRFLHFLFNNYSKTIPLLYLKGIEYNCLYVGNTGGVRSLQTFYYFAECCLCAVSLYHKSCLWLKLNNPDLNTIASITLSLMLLIVRLPPILQQVKEYARVKRKD